MSAPSAEEVAGSATTAILAVAQSTASRREIIYVGEMRIEVDDVEAAVSQMEKTVSAAGGWTSSRRMNTDEEGKRTASVEFRIPSARFGEIRDALRKSGEVVQDAVQSRDVGKEFVDLEARLRNLEREESVIAGLFDRKGKIADVLQVERELARVRGEIEQIQGQLRYLRDQVSYSTLMVSLAPTRPAIERRMESWNLGFHVLQAWRVLVGLARTLTYVAIYGLVVVGPLALLGWLIWTGVRGRIRRQPRAD